MILDSRKKELLCGIVEHYISQAEPVSSAALAHEFNLSPATIRNEMAELERLGLIYQPHTSAGRVPGEEGFKLYLAEFLKEKELSPKIKEDLNTAYHGSDFHYCLKQLSKKLADFSGEAVIVGYGKDDFYYTGLSNLFSKPEFGDQQLMLSLGHMFDNLDEVIYRMFDLLDDNVKIMIGRENPFGQDFSVLVTRYSGPRGEGLLAMLGPMRMEYKHNLGLINLAKNLIEEQLE